MNNKQLQLIGWNDDRAAECVSTIEQLRRGIDVFEAGVSGKESAKELTAGRIIGVHRDIFEVQAAKQRLFCTPSGRFRQYTDTWPAVGDWIVIEPVGEDRGVLLELLSRHSALSRGSAGERTAEQVIATNVDFIFIVSGLDRDFNPRRIERYVTLAWNSGAVPVVVLSKADMVEDTQPYTDQAETAAPGVDIVVTSVMDGTGLDKIRDYLEQGMTGVLVGSSGSGKSTLTNYLLNRDAQKTAEVRGSDQRGRHTTTSRTLFVLPTGGALIDTPGLREVGLWGDSAGVQESFREIAFLAERCRFDDCSHRHEPGCAVLAAVESGEITEERYQAYLKQVREMAYLADKREAQKQKEEWHRQISKEIRRYYKNRHKP